MNQNETLGGELPSLALKPVSYSHAVTIPNAPTIHLQTLDLARHVAIAPNGRRYVVATFDDTHLGNGIVTSVYPQQNDYLTLVKIVLYSHSSQNEDDAIQQHILVVQAIQQGRLNELVARV